MLTQSGFYALQAAIHLARRPETRVPAATIAGALDVPANYLAKVLQRLGREGVVSATRGPLGGYVLSASPDRISVADVVRPFEDRSQTGMCLMGGRCDPANPCSAHRRVVEWTRAHDDRISATTLADLLGPAGPDASRDNGAHPDPED